MIKSQSSSTTVLKQMIPTIKRNIIRRNAKIKHYKHSTSNKGNFTTKNKCALSHKKASNEIPVERTKSK